MNGNITGTNGYDIPYTAEINGKEEKIVIVAHGFASSKESPTVKMLTEEFPKNGLGIIALDFPGHGESPVGGELLSVENCMNDLKAVEDYVHENFKDAEVGYFGSSFGAYIIMHYIMNRDARGRKAFLRSAAVNMSEYFMEVTPAEKVALQRDGYFVIDDMARDLKVTAELIDDLKNHDLFKHFDPGNVGVKMIHGSLDEDIDYDRAKEFAVKHGIELVTVEGGDHRLSIPQAPETVLKEALEFFK